MIYICYGVTKSASTFLYQMTEEVFTAAGRKPARLGPPFRRPLSLDNYTNVLDPEVLRQVREQAGKRDVVVKTHGDPHPDIAARIEAGEVLASACIRDPSEIALSMLDHARRSRRWGYREFAEFGAIEDTFPSLDEQIDRFSTWAALPGVRVFTYNEICFETAQVIDRLAEQIGAGVRRDGILNRFRGNRGIGQFNKGAALRYRELSAEQRSVFLDRYAALYGQIAFDTPAARLAADRQRHQRLRARGQFGQYFNQVRRLLRV
jgi:hypothetical protein